MLQYSESPITRIENNLTPHAIGNMYCDGLIDGDTAYARLGAEFYGPLAGFYAGQIALDEALNATTDKEVWLNRAEASLYQTANSGIEDKSSLRASMLLTQMVAFRTLILENRLPDTVEASLAYDYLVSFGYKVVNSLETYSEGRTARGARGLIGEIAVVALAMRESLFASATKSRFPYFASLRESRSSQYGQVDVSFLATTGEGCPTTIDKVQVKTCRYDTSEQGENPAKVVYVFPDLAASKKEEGTVSALILEANKELCSSSSKMETSKLNKRQHKLKGKVKLKP